MEPLQLIPSPGPRRGKRVPIDPTPRFKPDIELQSDVIWGLLDSQVDEQHLVRAVWRIVECFDVSSLERNYSALGRRGYPPRRLLAIWIYASLIGEHEASKLAVRAKTDAALRWLGGGRAPSVATLKRFRQTSYEVLASALIKTIEIALELDLIDAGDISIDSVKIRANASTSAVRTLERSRRRLEELSEQDLDAATDEDLAIHASKVEKHDHAVTRCEAEGRSNFVVTNELAGLMKLPSGASAPAHRVTVTAAGVRSRFVLAMLIDTDSNDYGKLVAAAQAARTALMAAGYPGGQRLDVAADAGYFSRDDLVAAAAEASWLDVVVASKTSDRRTVGKYFGRDRFQIIDGKPPRCPAGRKMGSLYVRPDGEQEWAGVGCHRCALRSSCTPGKLRRFTIIPELEAMRRRLANPRIKARYNRRIATIEPVFSHIVDAMGYRRASSRNPDTIRAEILLKVVAHNVARLLAAAKLRLVLLGVAEF